MNSVQARLSSHKRDQYKSELSRILAGNVKNISLLKKPGGRPRKTSAQQDDIVKYMLARNPLCTATEILCEFDRRQIKSISRRTIQRRLNNFKEQQKRNIQLEGTIEINADRRLGRLRWALAHKDWDVDQWRSVFSMNKSKIDVDKPYVFSDTLTGPKDSPELSVMEHLIEIIKPKLDESPPQNGQELRAMLDHILNNDPDLNDKIELLYASMPLRVHAVIYNVGGSIDKLINI